MEYPYYEKLINKRTRLRYDITPIFRNPNAFSNLVDDLVKPFRNQKIDAVAGLDAIGFVLASGAALKLKKPLILIRKGGKLPIYKKRIISTQTVDYSGKSKIFEMDKSSVRRGDRILLIDEWIETGAQAKAAVKIIKKLGGKVIGISVLGAEKNEKTETLFRKFNCKAISK